MPAEPTTKRAIAFFDGQNLFYAAKEAFGYSYPNYDPKLLAERICASEGWTVAGIHFYTGVPSPGDKPDWDLRSQIFASASSNSSRWAAK